MNKESEQTRQLKPEQAAAAHTLDRHVSVTAGPGAGKTFVLVERYLEILRTKKVSVDNIVAITFTNRAANEMRQRVRERIDGLLRVCGGPERRVWLRHKRTLEGAVITTIHGFCSRLLREFPVEADVDPQFVLLDEHQSSMLLETVVEETLADAIHHGNETIVQFAQGTGRAVLANALIQLHQKYRGEGVSLDHIERLTASAHATRAEYDRYFQRLEQAMADLFSVRRLTPAAEEKRAAIIREWPALRAVLAHPPTEKTIAAYSQAIEDLWEFRPRRGTHPAFDQLDPLLWGDKPGANDCLRGSVASTGFDLLAREYSLAVLKLLRRVDQRLDAEKQRLSVLDFDDLQLRALRLLGRREVLARVSERYKFFLVDEFQDTNGLQRDLMTKLGLMRGANLFIVGDRKQSIYGFRGADVDVFAQMTAAMQAAGGIAQPLLLNFRSQAPLVDSLNFLFGKIFEARLAVADDDAEQLGYVQHEASVAQRGAEDDPPHVELLISVQRDEQDDGGQPAIRNASPHERDAEQVAIRVHELAQSGYEYRHMAILLRAFTGVWGYESALRRAGIPYLTVQGKGFYQREEITDLIQLLRFLDNTTDELALAAVLRSPLCGLSDNALFALRCAPWQEEPGDTTHLKRRPLMTALRHHAQIQFIDQAEQAALDRAHAWLEKLIARRKRYGLADLLRYAVRTSEFLTIIAANFDGAQRISNVEKLFRLAEQFEKTGFLIRDFVHYVAEFEAVGGREGEGQMDETANVVRLMTIHQAKGLEFPVVILPDLHRDPPQRNSAFVLDRHKGLTVQVPDGRSRFVRGSLFNELVRRSRRREQFESLRLLYVAATRAEDRLILSGAVNQKELENLTRTETDKWLPWIWQALELDAHPQSGIRHFEDVQIQLTVQRDGPRSLPAPVAEVTEKAAEPSDSFTEIFPLLARVQPDPRGALRRFSVTQLINFQRCRRQYYFERMLRTPGREERDVWNDAEAPEPPANLTATLKGAVIHRFCEAFRDGEDPQARLETSFDEVLWQRQSELAGRDFDIDRAEAVRALLPLAQNYLASDVFQRVLSAQNLAASAKSDWEQVRTPALPARPGLWSELRFRLRRPRGILTGAIDKLLIVPAAGGDGFDVEIIDFKTNRFSAITAAGAAHRVATATISTIAAAPMAGQASFDFDAVAETASVNQVETQLLATIDDQVQSTAKDYQLQMQAYALALRELLTLATAHDGAGRGEQSAEEHLKIRSLRATLHFLDPNIDISVSPSLLEQTACAAAIDDTMTEIALLDGTLDADQFPPAPAMHCRICNYVDLCPAGRHWLRQRKASE